MAEALHEYRPLGATSVTISRLLIEAYIKVGRTQDAQKLLAEAVRNAQQWDEAELLRLKGNLFLAQSVQTGPKPKRAFAEVVSAPRSEILRIARYNLPGTTASKSGPPR